MNRKRSDEFFRLVQNCLVFYRPVVIMLMDRIGPF